MLYVSFVLLWFNEYILGSYLTLLLVNVSFYRSLYSLLLLLTLLNWLVGIDWISVLEVILVSTLYLESYEINCVDTLISTPFNIWSNYSTTNVPGANCNLTWFLLFYKIMLLFTF